MRRKLREGGFLIGEVRVRGDTTMHHWKDDPLDPGIAAHDDPEAARHIALFDGEGNYRPLKSAPNLARGWLLRPGSLEGLRLALDFFYPAAVGVWLAWKAARLSPVPWRETLSRQSGMYRVVAQITDEQTRGLIARACQRETGCLRRILWPLEPGAPHPLTCSDPAELLRIEERGEIPILCAEACNLLVAAGRPIVKAARKAPADQK